MPWKVYDGVIAAMTKCAWLFVIALGIVFEAQAFAQQSPEQPIDQQTESNGQQQGQSNAAPLGFPIRILEEPEQSEDAKRENREAAQREIEDLEAQQLAAKAAYGSVWLSAFQAFIALIGTAALIYSLFLNRKATNAAVRATGIAKIMYEMESKPFLSVELIAGEQFRIVDGRMGKYVNNEFVEQDLLCRLVNGGRTVAIAARLFRVLEVADPKAAPKSITPEIARNSKRKGFISVMKDIQIPVGPNAPSPQILTGVCNDEVIKTAIADVGQHYWLYLHGFLEFSTAVGSARGRTKFCFLYNSKFPSRGFYVALPNGEGKHWTYDELE